MKTYKLKFNSNNQFNLECKNLDAAQEEAVSHMTNFDKLNVCEITCPNGALSIVRKDGSWHWNHNGFSFAPVLAEQVKQYRLIQLARAM